MKVKEIIMSLYQYVSVYRLKVLLRCCRNSTADDFLCYLPSSLCFLCKPGSRRIDFLKPVKSFTDGKGGRGFHPDKWKDKFNVCSPSDLSCILYPRFFECSIFAVQDKYHCPIFFLMDLDYKELRGREFPASKLL